MFRDDRHVVSAASQTERGRQAADAASHNQYRSMSSVVHDVLVAHKSEGLNSMNRMLASMFPPFAVVEVGVLTIARVRGEPKVGNDRLKFEDRASVIVRLGRFRQVGEQPRHRGVVGLMGMRPEMSTFLFAHFNR